MLKPECNVNQGLNNFGTFSFSTDGVAGFSYSGVGSEKSDVSVRSRPRMKKMRRKQMGSAQNSKSETIDFGLNGSSVASGEVKLDGELKSVFRGRDGNSGSNSSAKNGDLNGNSQQFGNFDSGGLGCGVNFSGFAFSIGGLGKMKSFSGSATNSSDSKLYPKDGLNLNSSNSDLENRTFVFGASATGSGTNQKLQGGGDEFENVNNTRFAFGANKNGYSVNNLDQQRHVHGVNKDGGKENTMPDIGGKVKLDSTVDSEKVCYPCFKFPPNCSDDSKRDNTYFVFGSNNSDSEVNGEVGGKTTSELRSNFAKCNQGNSDKTKFENAFTDAAFVFGACNGSRGISPGGLTEEMNQVNRESVDRCNECKEHNHNIGLDTEDKFRKSRKKDFVYNISDQMKNLNIDGSDGTQNITSNSSTANVDDVFVFGSNQKYPGSMRNPPSSMTPDLSHLSQNDAESGRTSSSVGGGGQLNGGFCEVPFADKGKKEGISFTSKLDGLHSSDANCSTPNTKLPFSNFNFNFGVDNMLDNANVRSLRGKRLKKTKGKLRKNTLVQDLFGQSHSSIGSSKKNNESPGCGSPMEFSPYQDSSAGNAPATGTETGQRKEELAGAEKDISGHCESSRDEESNSNCEPTLPAQDGLSAIRRQYKKKYKLKVGSNQKVQGDDSDKGDTKQRSLGLEGHEVSEHWRIRGNKAYHAGELSKAEEFYSTGIDSVQHASTLGYSMQPLLLCYSNRAATRMSLGRLREAIDDCTKAAALDPSFLKVTLRAGNCYLILGEIDSAIRCYNNCLGSDAGVCLDRRITVEAADGLQKAKKVAERMSQSATLLQEGTHNAAGSALENIAEALAISRYSEKLLEMKGEAMCILRMYDEVIELCEQTQHIAKRNFAYEHSYDPKCEDSHLRLWRWRLRTKCHYHLGKLDLALDMIEHEKVPADSKSGDVNKEITIALAASIKELLLLKKSGNEAFHSGRHSEAVDHYTAAISKSVESRPFMAICFCNRAAAYQSMSQIVDAISDCSLAIALDENYSKAISRRATLHEMIRDYKEAVNDLQRLISLLEKQSRDKSGSEGRSNGGSVRDLRKARRQISLMEERAKQEAHLDLYLILGIKASDTESEIKKAYRKAALRHHPDKAGQVLVRSDVGDALWKEVGEKIHNDADRLFKVIGEAYAVLSDPSKRSTYDNEEERRNVSLNSNRNSHSGRPSTSYSTSPYGKGTWSKRQEGFGNSRRHWYDRSYDNPYSRW